MDDTGCEGLYARAFEEPVMLSEIFNAYVSEGEDGIAEVVLPGAA